MSKVIIQFPYALKKDRKEELTKIYKKQWEEGLLILDGLCKVVIRPDDDVIIVEAEEKPVKRCMTCKYDSEDGCVYSGSLCGMNYEHWEAKDD